MKNLLLAGVMACVCATSGVAQMARSVPISGTVSASGAVPASGGCSFANGTAVCGPFEPSVGFPVRLTLKGGASFSGFVGTSTDGCATVNPLTAGGVSVGYAGSVDEYVDMPATTGGAAYCLTITVAAGTESYVVRQ